MQPLARLGLPIRALVRYNAGMTKSRRKTPDAVEMGRKRWAGVPKAKRREAARRAAEARWAKPREKTKGKIPAE